MSRKIYIIIAVVLTVVLSVSTFFIIRNHIDSAKQNEVYDNLAEIVEDEPPKENEGVTFSEDKDYLAEYLELYRQNEDMVGWIKYHHHEVGGCGQLEIEVELGEMTKMADATMTVKYIIKNAAAQAGKEVIEAKLWTEANINFEKDPDVVYSLPGENDILLLHDADGQSVLLAAWSGAGASVEYKFTGTSVNIYNNVENDSVTNDLRVYLDGELIETVDDRKPFMASWLSWISPIHSIFTRTR